MLTIWQVHFKIPSMTRLHQYTDINTAPISEILRHGLNSQELPIQTPSHAFIQHVKLQRFEQKAERQWFQQELKDQQQTFEQEIKVQREKYINEIKQLHDKINDLEDDQFILQCYTRELQQEKEGFCSSAASPQQEVRAKL